jgi:hypothetical protein
VPNPGIYVETAIHAPLDEVWRLTQEPGLHQMWDLRFSTIDYLPRSEGEPQRFLYATRIGFGLGIAGEGESIGTKESATERTSALRFWSDSRFSLIREGRGYWKYIQRGSDVQFFTWYDYDVRWGWFGTLIDRTAFRPMIGWATAWSFDRLRLWAERGVPPRNTLSATLVFAISRLAIIFIWLWHGLVPKLLIPQADELHMLATQHVPAALLPWAGAVEIALALVGLSAWRWRGYFGLTAALMVAALGSVAATAPDFLAHAFNPLTLNLSVMALCAVGFIAAPHAAFAGRCKRRQNKQG